jgi:hypothetical protein
MHYLKNEAMQSLAMTGSMIPRPEKHIVLSLASTMNMTLIAMNMETRIYSLYLTMAIVYMKREYQGTFTSEPTKSNTYIMNIAIDKIMEASNMESPSLYFPYEKNIVINALYDTIEALGLSIDNSNSARGTVVVSDAESTGKMRIALDFCAKSNQTQVKFFSWDSNESFVERWSPVVLDELSGRMKWLHQLKG